MAWPLTCAVQASREEGELSRCALPVVPRLLLKLRLIVQLERDLLGQLDAVLEQQLLEQLELVPAAQGEHSRHSQPHASVMSNARNRHHEGRSMLYCWYPSTGVCGEEEKQECEEKGRRSVVDTGLTAWCSDECECTTHPSMSALSSVTYSCPSMAMICLSVMNFMPAAASASAGLPRQILWNLTRSRM